MEQAAPRPLQHTQTTKARLGKRRFTGSGSRKKVLVPVANGSEEMEAVMLPHFLSRALALL